MALNPLYRNKKWLHVEYNLHHKTIVEIAAFCDTSPSTIKNWMYRFGIQSRAETHTDVYHENGHQHTIDVQITPDGYNSSSPGLLLEHDKSNVALSCTNCGRLCPDHNHHKCEFCSCSKLVESNQNLLFLIRQLEKAFYDEVLTRDNHTCSECGSQDELTVYHLTPLRVICDSLIIDYGSCIDYDFNINNFRQFIKECVDTELLCNFNNSVSLCKLCTSSYHNQIQHNHNNEVYVYDATVLEVYDGDTITVDINLGFGLTHRTEVRLFGVNTSEIRNSDVVDKLKGLTAKNIVSALCFTGRRIKIQTFKSGKFGRWLGVIVLDNHFIMNDILIRKRLGEEYII